MKIIYEWLKRGRHAFLRRVELFSQEDLAKKPAIPQSKYAAAHQRILDERARRKNKHHG